MQKIYFEKNNIMDVLGEFFYDEMETYLKNNESNREYIESFYTLKKIIDSEDMECKYLDWLNDTWAMTWEDNLRDIINDSLFNAHFDYYYDDDYIYLIIDTEEIPLNEKLGFSDMFIKNKFVGFEKVNFYDFVDRWNEQNK